MDYKINGKTWTVSTDALQGLRLLASLGCLDQIECPECKTEESSTGVKDE